MTWHGEHYICIKHKKLKIYSRFDRNWFCLECDYELNSNATKIRWN